MTDSTPAPASRNQFSRLLDKVTRILAQRDHSEAEVRRKIALSVQRAAFLKEAAPEPIDEDALEKVILWCHEHDWLNDARFAQRFIASRSRKGYGPQRIRMELTQKGINREQSEQAFEACEIDWATQAYDIAERKFGLPFPVEWKEKAKMQRFLQARGFFSEDIQAVFRNFDE